MRLAIQRTPVSLSSMRNVALLERATARPAAATSTRVDATSAESPGKEGA
jgi:hypothetical protein